MTTTMTILPKPTVTPTSPTTWTIDFGTGATGTMERIAERPRDRWEWTVDFSDGRTDAGYSYGDALAFECAWCRAASQSAPTPLTMSEFEIRRLVQTTREQRDSKAWAKVFRDLLKRRTGVAWSVRVQRGTAGAWVSITAPPKRRNDYDMTAHDTALLAAVLGRGHVSRQGVSVSPDDRASTLREIIGPIETPASAVG